MAPAFKPARYTNISATLDQKRQALAAYDMEMRPFPHARSVETLEALAHQRGAQAGMEAAEAFGIIREIWEK
jgi:hypothetical protein